MSFLFFLFFLFFRFRRNLACCVELLAHQCRRMVTAAVPNEARHFRTTMAMASQQASASCRPVFKELPSWF
ncbi:hypothetical protein J8I87_30140 [Paraburkholderia sp. LEh10]|uniref:hypothetical protein n=1 Tax=Paraburkholderia sp. LEh10 TaxID=2821353 RepID=UPI001AE56690|nr:hypothetical protein [Paraburkholderia sp. LEh10]MBP0593868.1 hypothetical protein [Paraburkholderia sp. LEh10]